MRSLGRIGFVAALLLAFLASDRRTSRAAEQTSAPVAVRLAQDGKSAFPIVVAEKATPRIRRAASTLAEQLKRITEETFPVEIGDGRTGIALGLAGDFPALYLQTPWDPKDATHREDFLLRSHTAGVHVLGASEMAVE